MEVVVAHFTKPALKWSGGEKITKISVMKFEPGTLGTPNYTASYSRRQTCSEYSVLRSTNQMLYGSIGGAVLEGNMNVVQQNRNISMVV
jgi:hypothetical protein